MTWEEFMDMDVQDITNAVRFSDMPKEAMNLVWEKKRKAFEVFD